MTLSANVTRTITELEEAVAAAQDAAEGGSNDDELEALQQVVDLAVLLATYVREEDNGPAADPAVNPFA